MFGKSLLVISVLVLAHAVLIKGQIKFGTVGLLGQRPRPVQLSLNRCIVCKDANSNGECNTDARECVDDAGVPTGCKTVLIKWPGVKHVLYEKNCLQPQEECPFPGGLTTCKKLNWLYEFCTQCCYGDMCNFDELESKKKDSDRK